jgi:hypothetical protein
LRGVEPRSDGSQPVVDGQHAKHYDSEEATIRRSPAQAERMSGWIRVALEPLRRRNLVGHLENGVDLDSRLRQGVRT